MRKELGSERRKSSSAALIWRSDQQISTNEGQRPFKLVSEYESPEIAAKAKEAQIKTASIGTSTERAERYLKAERESFENKISMRYLKNILYPIYYMAT